MDEKRALGAQGPSVLIAGAGLAGLAAACELADVGYAVTVVERRPFAGGRVYSFVDPETGLRVDNGQHVFMRCCTAFTGFLRKLGVEGRTTVQPRMAVPVYDRRGRCSLLGRAALPAPAHLFPSFLTYRHLSWGEKLRAARALEQIRRTPPECWRALDATPFGDWLRAEGQSERAIDSLWNLIVRPLLNEEAERVSAGMAFMAFYTALLSVRGAGDIGFARVPLGDLFAEDALRYVRERRGRVILGDGVADLSSEGVMVTGAHLVSGAALAADAYVLAVPFPALAAVLPPELRESPPFAAASRLIPSPIVNVHLWFDGPVVDFPFAACLESDLQYVFNRNRLAAQVTWEGQYLDVSMSAAYRQVGRTNQELVQLALTELRAFFPRVRGARLLRSAVVRQRHATFAPLPGSWALRPGSVTPARNLFLAGDWVDTGWPATMEGAVRSGLAAAAAVRAATTGEKTAQQPVAVALR